MCGSWPQKPNNNKVLRGHLLRIFKRLIFFCKTPSNAKIYLDVLEPDYLYIEQTHIAFKIKFLIDKRFYF